MGQSKGYVYVMINPSLKGLVKIGKTTKHPNERAKELSAATGVPTPYTVVFHREFYNCDIAEKTIHSILSERDCRVNDNREFFSIDTSEAINLIINLPNENISTNIQENDCSGDNDDEDISEVYYNQGEECYYGLNGKFQDLDEAIFHYKQSAKLGNSKAFLRLGQICNELNNEKAAIKYFKEGRSSDCYAELGKIYMNRTSDNHSEYNANMAWKKYFEMWDVYNERGVLAIVVNNTSWGDYVNEYMFYSHLYDFKIDGSILKYICKYKPLIISKIQEKINFICNNVNKFSDGIYGVIDDYRKIKSKLEIMDDDYLRKESLRYFEEGNNSFKFTNGYRNCERAMEYFQKSVTYGNLTAYAKIGCVALVTNDLEKCKNAWTTFYNYVYDSITSEKGLSADETNIILNEYVDIFSYALSSDHLDILHPFYICIAIKLGIIEYYTKTIERLSKNIEQLKSQIDSFSFFAKMLNSDKLKNIYHDIHKNDLELISIRKLHQYVKEIVAETQNNGNNQLKFYRL